MPGYAEVSRSFALRRYGGEEWEYYNGIILKKCDNVQVCACVGVGNGIKYARSMAGCFAARK